MTKVILGFGNGNLDLGCDRVTVEIRDDDDKLIARGNGSLPDSPQLWNLYNSWKSSFRSRFGGRIIIPQDSGSRSSMVETTLSECINQFPRELNQWLNCDDFRPIEKLLRNHISLNATINFTVEAEDNQLRRLPWYLWEFFDDYHHAEPSLAFSKYESGRIGKSKRDNVRILVVIGDSQGINTEVDKKIFSESLGDTRVKILSQPSPFDLDECLWDEQGWDILAFLGHSGSSDDGSSGSIKINSTERLSLSDLKNALFSAIKKGLKLAIFNSCDGLGLVGDLRDLYLPHTIVMREPVPDKIAQEFIKSFLPAFKGGKSLAYAVREAREKLQKWENDYPCATWLPVLCQNPGVESINWVNLGGKPACPYRGLFAFKEEDADIFCGREAVSDELYQRVESRQRLIAVVGASGSGKSSVVFAGLIPRLRNTEVEVVNFRPGRNPFESLAVALAPLLCFSNAEERGGKRRGAQRFIDLEGLIAKLKDKGGLCEVVETIVASSKRRLVLVADQFEELYTLLPASEQKTCELFLDSLLNAVNQAPDFSLVLTLRVDFFKHAIKYTKFADALQDNNYILRAMNRQELQEAIRIPAEKRGVKLEAGLLELLLEDVGEKADNLPLLEFALTQLWRKQEYGLLTRAAYQEIGGLEQSLARHAEDIYAQLNKEQRQIMQRVFIQLVRPGEGAADTRNVVSKSELRKSDWDLITSLNQENARLLVINYDQNKQETVEIVHEALINGWGLLNNWMSSHRQFRTWQERLKVEMKNWQEKQRSDDYLLIGGGLGEAEEWLNSVEHREYLSDSQREFIRLSLDARNRKIKEEKRKQKQTVIRLSSALGLALIATVFAGLNWMQSEKSRIEANLNSLIVTSKSRFDGELYDDAFVEAMKAKQLLANTPWKKWIANDIKRKIDVAIHDATYKSIFVNKTLKGHQDRVWSVVFSPDGKTIASSSSDNTVKIWDAKTFKLIQTLKGHQHEVRSVVFSPDGKTIASASYDNTVKIWDAKTFKLIQTLQGHQNTVISVVFSPVSVATPKEFGKTIASASSDNTVKIWDAATGKLIRTLKGHQRQVNSVVFSPDSKTIASASYDNTVKIWDAKTFKLSQTLTGHENIVWSVEFSPDGKTIASASSDNTVKIWDAATGKLSQTLKGDQSEVNWVKFSPDGKTIASASSDKTVKIWDIATGKPIQTLKGHQNSVVSVEFSPDGKTIASASYDNTVKIWDAKTSKPIPTLKGHQSEVWSVEFSPVSVATPKEFGKTIASASSDNTVKIWDAPTGKLIRTLRHQNKVYSVEFSPDGKTIASASRDGTVKIWDGLTFKEIQTLKGHQNSVNSVEFSPDGKTIASASFDNTVKIWDAATGKLIRTLKEHQSEVWSVEFSPDGKTIASASEDKTVKIWDAKTFKLIQTLKGHQRQVNSVEFSPDGKTIASASGDNTVKIWDAKTFKLIQTLRGHQNWVRTVVFSPDGKTIASASGDNTVKIWDAKTFKEIQTLKGHQKSVLSVVFSPDGKTIASASRDNTVKLWNWDLYNLVKKGCERFKLHLANHPDKLEEVELCQNRELFIAAASTLVEEGEELASEGNFEEAVEKFRQANKWNSELNINPEAKAAIALIIKGKELAKNGNFEEAVEKFKQAQQFDRNIDLNPETEKVDKNPQAVAEKLAAPSLTTQGKELVRDGKVKEAIAAYNKALKFNPELEISADDWNTLCWYGAINSQAKDVMFACKQAVALAPKHGGIIDSRGLARALTRDTSGAIKDFEVYVNWTKDDKKKSQRQSWIKDLRNGKNPFTEEVLEELRQ